MKRVAGWPAGVWLVLPCSALACATLAGTARSQADVVTLQQSIDAALENGAQLQLGERQVRLGEGTLLGARAPFGARLVTSLSTDRRNSFPTSTSLGAGAILTSTVATTVALPKRFRSGLTVTPHVDFARAEVAQLPGALSSRASVGLDASVPLLRDRGGEISVAAERSARHALHAALLDVRHIAAASVLAAVVAYWNDLAAEQRLEVYRSSEARASQLVADTRRLVEADERPAADLAQLLANLALKRAARLAGEQASLEAGEQLALAMGVRLDLSAALPRPITNFPEVRASGTPSARGTQRAPVAIGAPGAAPVSRFVKDALGRRADLAALVAERAAAGEQLRAARDGLRPRLDLLVGIGYQGATSDPGLGGAVASLYRNVRGLDLSVRLSYELPISSLAARGEVLRSGSIHQQARIREAELERAIASGVRVARAALSHGRDALLASREAVTLSRDAVASEKRKFQLGMSTLFDVILAEDALTNARLSEIAGQQAYATALVRLRYETGVLLDAGTDSPRVSAASLGREP